MNASRKPKNLSKQNVRSVILAYLNRITDTASFKMLSPNIRT